MTLDFRIK